MRTVFAVILTLLCGMVSAPLMAQTIAAQEIPQEIPQPERATSTNFVSDFVSDQKDIWTSPLHIKRGDVEWLAPMSVGAAALFATDHRISDAAKTDTSLRSPSNAVSNIGAYAPYAIPATMWFLGAVTHNDHTLEAGRLGTEAELDTEVVGQALTFTTNRTRPNGAHSHSFPSGHAASAFALASVLSSEY